MWPAADSRVSPRRRSRFPDAGPASRSPFADFDNDGRADVMVTTLTGHVKLFRNITAGANHWRAVRLRGQAEQSSGARRGSRDHVVRRPPSHRKRHHIGRICLLERAAGTIWIGNESGGGPHCSALAGRPRSGDYGCAGGPGAENRGAVMTLVNACAIAIAFALITAAQPSPGLAAYGRADRMFREP